MLDACVAGQYPDGAELSQQKWENLSCPVLTRTGRTWRSPITNLNEWHQNKAATVSPPCAWSTLMDRRFPMSFSVAPTQVERSTACTGFDLSPFLLLWPTFVAAKLKLQPSPKTMDSKTVHLKAKGKTLSWNSASLTRCVFSEFIDANRISRSK